LDQQKSQILRRNIKEIRHLSFEFLLRQIKLKKFYFLAGQFFRQNPGQPSQRDAHALLVGHQDEGADGGEHDEGQENIRTAEVHVDAGRG